jgi:hypothetical protein
MEPTSKKAPSKRADYYGTFLEAVKQAPPDVQQRGPVEAQPQEPIGVPPAGEQTAVNPAAPHEAAEGANVAEAVDPISLLKVLRDSGAQPMTQLHATTNLSFSRFSQVFAKLEEAGLVTISGNPGSENVELSAAGKTLADLG